ncbi:unnamed protein product [Schistosoma spindalis]|nr:unnamed protein product [Schistosoma spindale]
MSVNTTNCNELIDELKFMWIEHELGPQRMSLTRQILIGIVYTSIFCTGLLGNLATCIVIARNSFMHTRTNCYLFTLSVSDLLLLIFEDAFNDYYVPELISSRCLSYFVEIALFPIISNYTTIWSSTLKS